MTPPKEIRNAAASIHQRLLNLPRARDADFNLILQRYLCERFLYRLGLSTEVDRFTLKGAALFLVWAGKEFRATRDIDLLSEAPEDRAAVRDAIARICSVPCPDDGLWFDPDSIQVAPIREEQEHGGLRVRVRAELGSAQLFLQVDVGFGDVVTPSRDEAGYPTLLDLPAPRIWTYPRETFVAEKFEAMVRLGPANSRMKDFWDVAALAGQFRFDGESLSAAVEGTFGTRGTTVPITRPEALRPAFYQEAPRIRLWEAFRTRNRAQIDVPARFDAVGELVISFLDPIRESLVAGGQFTNVWPAGGLWGPASAVNQESGDE